MIIVKKVIKIILPLFLVVFLAGCNLGNSPTSKVEELMTKYQTVDKDIKDNIDDVLNNYEMTEDQANRYRKILESQYKNLAYNIKEEEIDGDIATVKVEIEVKDYRKVVDRVESEYIGTDYYNTSDYIDYKLNELEKAKDKVTYTINFTCTKAEDGIWEIDNLSNLDIQKIQGMY
jgi:hypothetical protein